jgi:hypothetical protein
MPSGDEVKKFRGTKKHLVGAIIDRQQQKNLYFNRRAINDRPYNVICGFATVRRCYKDPQGAPTKAIPPIKRTCQSTRSMTEWELWQVS